MPKYKDVQDVFETQDLLEFVNYIWETQTVNVGGYISFDTFIANGIKFFTQSMYSHIVFVNIYDEQNKPTFATLGAEKKGIKLIKYQNGGNFPESLNKNHNFYYVVKKIDIEKIVQNFDWEKANNMIYQTFRYHKPFDLKQKFINFCNIFGIEDDNIKNISLEKALDTGLKELNENDLKELNKDDSKKINKYDFDEIKQHKNYTLLLKKFILLGIIKYMIKSHTKSYDSYGVLTLWKRNWERSEDYTDIEFCSEFVSDTMIYAGFYPFDIQTKLPSSVTPGDIMEIDHIYNDVAVWHFNVKDKNVYFAKESINPENTIKDHIIAEQKKLFRYKISLFTVGLIESAVKTKFSRVVLGFFVIALFLFVIINTIIGFNLSMNQNVLQVDISAHIIGFQTLLTINSVLLYFLVTSIFFIVLKTIFRK